MYKYNVNVGMRFIKAARSLTATFPLQNDLVEKITRFQLLFINVSLYY